MGLTYKPIAQSGFPFELAKELVEKGYTVCVETGTFKGLTTKQLTTVFEQVYTIEAFEALYQEALVNLKGLNNVTPLLGDSREKLPEILDKLKNSKVIFWLDAHYSGGDTFYNFSPLINELKLINESLLVDPIIIVDDARYVLAEVELSTSSRYANLPEFINELNRSNHYISYVDDKFIAVPVELKDILDKYTARLAEEDLKFIAKYNKSLKFFKKYQQSFWFRIKCIFRKKNFDFLE